jgi:pyruvate formate lyase activating enzyme
MSKTMNSDTFDPRFTVPARYWHAVDQQRIQCDLCPRYCRLKNGQRGFCFVRANHNGNLVLTSYGRSSGFCIDPIEKKPLNHFLPGTPVLSFGTAGCNLSCKFCQNWDISKSRQTDRLAAQAQPGRIAEVAAAHQCRSVAFTYNDPVIFHEYAIDVAAACHKRGIKTVAVSAGYVCPEPRQEFYAHIDAANIDLKAFTDQFYVHLTGSQLQPVLDSLIYLKHETRVWLEITTLLIPGKNDSAAEIDALTRWIFQNLGADTPLHFSAFHPDFKMMDIAATPISTLTRARQQAMDNGLQYVYTGNVHDKPGGSTYCSKCGERLIGRDWYVLSDWTLDQFGCCKRCGTLCPGVFDPRPGDWGARRLPVDLH